MTVVGRILRSRLFWQLVAIAAAVYLFVQYTPAMVMIAFGLIVMVASLRCNIIKGFAGRQIMRVYAFLIGCGILLAGLVMLTKMAHI